jgi:hypothetical protein
MKANLILITLVCGMALCIPSCMTEPGFTEEDREKQEDKEVPGMPEDAGDTDDEALNPNTQALSYANAVGISFTGEGVAVDNPFNGNEGRINMQFVPTIIFACTKETSV